MFSRLRNFPRHRLILAEALTCRHTTKKNSICNSWALFWTISGLKQTEGVFFHQDSGIQSQLSFSDVSCHNNIFRKLLRTTKQNKGLKIWLMTPWGCSASSTQRRQSGLKRSANNVILGQNVLHYSQWLLNSKCLLTTGLHSVQSGCFLFFFLLEK